MHETEKHRHKGKEGNAQKQIDKKEYRSSINASASYLHVDEE